MYRMIGLPRIACIGVGTLCFAVALDVHAGFKESLAAFQLGDYARAAVQFIPLAQSGAAKNVFTALTWFHRAANQEQATEQGHIQAQYQLARRYETGHGVPQSDRAAEIRLLNAAEQGYVRAQYELGEKYANGRGVAVDFVQAYQWYRLARTAGDDKAKEKQPTVALRMTRAQIDEARTLAQRRQGDATRHSPAPSTAIQFPTQLIQ